MSARLGDVVFPNAASKCFGKTAKCNLVSVVGFAYHSRLFDLRIGAGYGRFIVPRFGFVYLQTGLALDFAAYFRF